MTSSACRPTTLHLPPPCPSCRLPCSNYYTRLQCDTLKLAMIKNKHLAQSLFRGDVYDCVCRFDEVCGEVLLLEDICELLYLLGCRSVHAVCCIAMLLAAVPV